MVTGVLKILANVSLVLYIHIRCVSEPRTTEIENHILFTLLGVRTEIHFFSVR